MKKSTVAMLLLLALAAALLAGCGESSGPDYVFQEKDQITRSNGIGIKLKNMVEGNSI